MWDTPEPPAIVDTATGLVDRACTMGWSHRAVSYIVMFVPVADPSPYVIEERRANDGTRLRSGRVTWPGGCECPALVANNAKVLPSPDGRLMLVYGDGQNPARVTVLN